MSRLFFHLPIRWTAGAVGLTLALGAALPVRGQEIPGVVKTPPSAKELAARAAVIAAAPVVPFPVPPQTLPPFLMEQALQQVDRNHPKLAGAQVAREIATAKRIEKQGAFDPFFDIGSKFLRYNSSRRPAESVESDFGIGFMNRYGIKFFAGGRYNYGRIKSPASLTGDGGEYFLSLKIPLLRGARVNEKSVAERQAKLTESAADLEIMRTRLDLLRKAGESYWDWVAAKRKLEVARSLLEIARVRAVAVTDRADLGDLPPIDKVEAEQEVKRREGNLTKAERDLQKATFKFAGFLWRDTATPDALPDDDTVPSATPPPMVLRDDEVTQGRSLALQLRPELKLIAIDRDIARVEAERGRNLQRPDFDIDISPGRDTGFGGIGNTFKAGISITIPVRNRTADGVLAAAELKIRKLNLDEANERQRILLEVDDAVSAVNTARERYYAAEQEFQLALTLEKGEREKFALGDSTLFLVNQRERARAEAATKVIDIQAEYEQAKVAFRAVTGQL